MLRQDSSVDLDAGAKRVALISQNLPKLTATHIICGNLYMPKNLNFLYSYRGSYIYGIMQCMHASMYAYQAHISMAVAVVPLWDWKAFSSVIYYSWRCVKAVNKRERQEVVSFVQPLDSSKLETLGKTAQTRSFPNQCLRPAANLNSSHNIYLSRSESPYLLTSNNNDARCLY